MGKRTSRQLRDTLFGSLFHVWLFDERCAVPDRSSHSAYTLARDSTAPLDRLLPLVIDTCAERFRAIGSGEVSADPLPEVWLGEPYGVPAALTELAHLYGITVEPEQLALETGRLGGLWSDFTLHFCQAGQVPRPPVKALSQWHVVLALAAGAISGVLTSPNGRVLILKGDTYQEKVSCTDFNADEYGNALESRILTGRFVPVIWG